MRIPLVWMALAASLAACGGGTTTGSGGSGGSGGTAAGEPCGEHPLACAAGDTCWFTSEGTFTCQPSGTGIEGATCSPLVDQPTCGDGLLCVKASDADGVCTKLCDPSGENVCGGGFCTLVQTAEGGETHVCT